MDFNAVFKKMFPFIATAASLGGPLGIMAARAAGAAIGVDNLEPKNLEDAITAAQIKDPAIIAKMKEADQNFATQMQALGFENVQALEKIAADDRANARAREIAVKDDLPKILALVITLGFFTLLVIFTFHGFATNSATLLNIMIGSLGTAWISIVNYYFGSSSGSAAKTEILDQQLKK